jgi:hypothetical protein
VNNAQCLRTKKDVAEKCIQLISKCATWLFQITIEWHCAVTHKSLLSRDSSSQHRCCGEDHYAGPREFHQQIDSNQHSDHNPAFIKHGDEYHFHSRNPHQYYDDYYYRSNRLKYFDYKSPPSKYSYHKEYYTRGNNNPPLPETKYVQKRIGVVFPDTNNNINDGRGGYRPHVLDSHFHVHRYYENNNGFNNFRNKDDHQGYHELPEDKYRQKYRPGLLGVSVSRSGAVVVTGPDGYKHVIHNLPPWTELNTTPEKEHYQGSFPGNTDPRGDLEHPGSHRFSTGFHGNPGVYDHQKHRHQSYKGVPIYFWNSGNTPDKKNYSQFVTVYKNSLKSQNGNRNQKQGPPEDTSDILHQTDKKGEQNYTAPPKPDKFHPSPPFYRYSEPDPLHHPNGSPLHTYSTIEPTHPSTTPPSKSSTTSKPQEATQSPGKPLKYPDSINAQLPPPAHDTDIRVPYVAATALTEQTPYQYTSAATQASDATHKKTLIQVLPTIPSAQSFIESEVPSSLLLIQTTTVQKKKTFLPASLVQETSTHPAAAKVPIHPTQTAQTDNSIKTEHFLPTIITEKPHITPHQSTEPQISYTTQPSQNTTNHNIALPPSPQEFLNVIHKSGTKQISSTNDTKNTGNQNYIATVYVTTVAPLQSSSNPNTSTVVSDSLNTDTIMSTEINTLKTQASTVVTETVPSSIKTKAEGNSDLIHTLKYDTEDIQSTTGIDKTEQVTENYIGTMPNESNLHAGNNVTELVPSMLNQLQTLVNHAHSLNYLHHDYSTTVMSTDESDS